MEYNAIAKDSGFVYEHRNHLYQRVRTTGSTSQSFPVFGQATTSLLPPLKVRGTNETSLPTDPRDADAAITRSRSVSLGDASFYGGSVNAGDGDTALIFASDGQTLPTWVQLLCSCRLVYVDATFRVVPSLLSVQCNSWH